MTASLTPPAPDLPRLLDIASTLHEADGPVEFFDRLRQYLPETAGAPGFTWLALEGGEGAVLYSTEIPAVHERLIPPRIDSRTLAQLLGRSYGTIGGGDAIQVEVEGKTLVSREIWRLPGEAGALIMLHATEPITSPIDDEAARNALVSAIGRAWLRLRQLSSMEERLEHAEAKLSAVGEIGEMLGSLEVDVLLTKLMELSLYVVKGQVGSIVLVDDAGERSCPVEWGLPLETASCFQDSDGRVVIERVCESGEAFRSSRSEGSESLEVVGAEVHVDSYLSIPLTSQSRTIGVINIVNSLEEEGFSDLDTEVLLAISGLAATSIENAILHHDSLEKERLGQSMQIARDIQQRLYPSEPPPLDDNLEVAWRSEPCDETGGDYFDFIDTPNGLAVIVGDVSGHGVGSALLMASARAGLRAALARGAPIAEAVSSINDQLELDTDPDQFMTLLVLAWAPGAETIEYVNAGHDTPCIFRREEGKLETLAATGIPIGLFAGAGYETGTFSALQTGDALLLTTDGVWEVADPEGRMLGKPVLLELFRGFARYPADKIAQEILEAVGSYTHHAPLRDDRTLLVFRAL